MLLFAQCVASCLPNVAKVCSQSNVSNLTNLFRLFHLGLASSLPKGGPSASRGGSPGRSWGRPSRRPRCPPRPPPPPPRRLRGRGAPGSRRRKPLRLGDQPKAALNLIFQQVRSPPKGRERSGRNACWQTSRWCQHRLGRCPRWGGCPGPAPSSPPSSPPELELCTARGGTPTRNGSRCG